MTDRLKSNDVQYSHDVACTANERNMVADTFEIAWIVSFLLADLCSSSISSLVINVSNLLAFFPGVNVTLSSSSAAAAASAATQAKFFLVSRPSPVVTAPREQMNPLIELQPIKSFCLTG